VNIWREIKSSGAGLVAPDTAAGTTDMLREWLSLTAEERQLTGQRARELFRSRFTVDAMAISLLEVIMQHSTLPQVMDA
jgi:glycosyltransferase involved in cell wall biosynthesis